MHIVICGAGEVGSHAAEVLVAAGHDVAVIDHDSSKLAAIEDTIDVRTIAGDCARASILAKAGCVNTDMILATTNLDEINLLSASVGKGLGAKKSIARVHHTDFFNGEVLDYAKHFDIDRLICPDYATALAIAESLRNPGAVAIEIFARGQIEMQQFAVDRDADAIGKPLYELPLPHGTRIAAICRMDSAFIPEAGSTIEPGDSIILVGNPSHFPVARKFFFDEKAKRRKIVIMGGPSMGVWLCRTLRDRNFSIRLFETDRARAEELAEKLDWVTVINGDPTDADLFSEERISEVDAFVALAHDEENILSCVLAKNGGVKHAIAVIERPKYIHLLTEVGIDRPFSPRRVAVREIERVLDDRPILQIASLAEGIIDVFRVRVGPGSEIVAKPLREVKLTPNWMVAGIQRGDTVHVPDADDAIQTGDTVLMIGRHGKEKSLRRLFNI